MSEQWKANIGLGVQVSALLGVLLGAWLQAVWTLIVPVLILAGLSTVWLSWRLTVVCMIAGGCLAGGAWYVLEAKHDIQTVQNTYQDTSLNGEGRIISYPEEQRSAFTYVIEVTSVSQPEYTDLLGEHIRIYDRYPTARWQYGESVQVAGTLTVPENASYKRYLASTGEVGVMYRPDITANTASSCAFICQRVRDIFALRSFLLSQISTVLPGVEGEFIKGILTGHDDRIPQAYQEDFQRTGISHLLAISGYHVTILMLVSRRVFARMWLPPWGQLLASMVLLGSFVIFIGFHGSVIRAASFLILVLLAQQMGQYFSGMRSLILAACLLALINPLFVAWNIAFQLSFIAALGIFSLAPVRSSLWNAHDWRLLLVSVMFETLAAEIFVIPVVLYAFGVVSVVSPIANLVVVPFIPFLMASGILLAIGASLPIIPSILMLISYPIHALLSIILETVRVLADIPWTAWEMSAPHMGWLGVYYVGLGVSVYMVRRWSIKRYLRRVI
ncbi:MAG: ComEC/Rec2 family competence protein [Candidatus Paceibacteria bacterium]